MSVLVQPAPTSDISFAFKRTEPAKKSVKTQLREEKHVDKIVVNGALTANDLSKSLQKSKLAATIKAPAKIIPMIAKNIWVPTQGSEQPEQKDDPAQPANDDDFQGTEDERAAASLIAAARNGGAVKENKLLPEAIPLLMQNAIPFGEEYTTEEEKFRYDVSLRPDSTSLAGYEEVTVEDFGVAMLMGMGWKPGEGVGKSNKQVVEPLEFLPRGARLGLGATEGLAPDTKHKKKFIKPGETREEATRLRVAPDADGRVRHVKRLGDRVIPVHSMRMRVNAVVEIVEGVHAGLYGRVVEFEGDAETCRKCQVRLVLNGDVVTLNRLDIQIMDEHALPRDHPALYPIGHGVASGDVSRKRSRRDNDEEEDKKKSKRRDSGREERREERRDGWLLRGIRVRVVSKSFLGGRIYNKKARVEDVLSPTRAVIIMDGTGEIIDDVKDKYLETAMPKQGGKVMILKGEHKTLVGTLIERNTAKAIGVVQLDGDLEVLTVSFDNLAEYVPG